MIQMCLLASPLLPLSGLFAVLRRFKICVSRLPDSPGEDDELPDYTAICSGNARRHLPPLTCPPLDGSRTERGRGRFGTGRETQGTLPAARLPRPQKRNESIRRRCEEAKKRTGAWAIEEA